MPRQMRINEGIICTFGTLDRLDISTGTPQAAVHKKEQTKCLTHCIY